MWSPEPEYIRFQSDSRHQGFRLYDRVSSLMIATCELLPPAEHEDEPALLCIICLTQLHEPATPKSSEVLETSPLWTSCLLSSFRTFCRRDRTFILYKIVSVTYCLLG